MQGRFDVLLFRWRQVLKLHLGIGSGGGAALPSSAGIPCDRTTIFGMTLVGRRWRPATGPHLRPHLIGCGPASSDVQHNVPSGAQVQRPAVRSWCIGQGRRLDTRSCLLLASGRPSLSDDRKSTN